MTMLHSIPALNTALRDRAIRGHAREVYLWLHDRLDLLEYRIVKQSAISHDLAMKDSTVSHAIKLLRQLGYIDRGERAYVQKGTFGSAFARGPWKYRLVHSVPQRYQPVIARKP